MSATAVVMSPVEARKVLARKGFAATKAAAQRIIEKDDALEAQGKLDRKIDATLLRAAAAILFDALRC